MNAVKYLLVSIVICFISDTISACVVNGRNPNSEECNPFSRSKSRNQVVEESKDIKKWLMNHKKESNNYCFHQQLMKTNRKDPRVTETSLESGKTETEYPGNSRYLDLSGCYNTSVGSKGSLQYLVHPEKYMSSTVCEWNIDVAKGSVLELEFEVFRLPISKENDCDSYLEISYSLSKDEVVKRHVCPDDTVDKISTGSQAVHILFKSGAYPIEHKNDMYGFKINYRAVAVNKPGGNYAVTVVLLSFAAVFTIALIFCCLRSHHESSNSATADVPHSEVIVQQSNAPTRAELQSAFELQRHVLQAPQVEKKYMSRTSSVNSKIASEKSFQNHPPRDLLSDFQERPKISIGPTPHLHLDEARRKWSSESIRRIRNLRTRLIARFSTHSSCSDISVFFEAPDRHSYSQLNCRDDGSPDEPTAPGREDKVSLSDPKPIPSVFIELVD